MAIKANLLKSIWSHDPILVNPLQHHFCNVEGHLVPFFFVCLFFDLIFPFFVLVVFCCSFTFSVILKLCSVL